MSLTALKSSRSISATLTLRCASHVVTARRNRSPNSARLGSWVNASWVAPWSSRASSRPFSWNAVTCRTATSAVSTTAPTTMTRWSSPRPDQVADSSSASTATTAAYGSTLNRRCAGRRPSSTVRARRCRTLATVAQIITAGMVTCEQMSQGRSTSSDCGSEPRLPPMRPTASHCRERLSTKASPDSTTLATANTDTSASTISIHEPTTDDGSSAPWASSVRVWKCHRNTAVASTTVAASRPRRSRSPRPETPVGRRYRPQRMTTIAPA